MIRLRCFDENFGLIEKEGYSCEIMLIFKYQTIFILLQKKILMYLQITFFWTFQTKQSAKSIFYLVCIILLFYYPWG